MSITVKAGQNKSWLLTFTFAAGGDLTGGVVDFWIMDDESPTPTTPVVQKTSANPGEIYLILTGEKRTATLYTVPIDTTGRGGTKLRYVIRFTDAGGKKFPCGEGHVVIEPWDFDV